MIKEMLLIHYGSKVYRPELVEPIQNGEHWNKPIGGLWTSPVDSNWGWKHWCLAENFSSCDKYFVLNYTGNTLVIDSVKDMRQMPLIEGTNSIDFEKIDKDYDAIHLTTYGEIATRYCYDTNLYGWDCETVLVMNKECIKQERNYHV